MHIKTVTYFTNPRENYCQRHSESLNELCQTTSFPLGNKFEEWQDIKKIQFVLCQTMLL